MVCMFEALRRLLCVVFSTVGKVRYSEKIVSMIRKYHNHTLQINLRNLEEESQKTDLYKVSSKVKHPNPALSLGDCQTRWTQSTE